MKKSLFFLSIFSLISFGCDRTPPVPEVDPIQNEEEAREVNPILKE